MTFCEREEIALGRAAACRCARSLYLPDDYTAEQVRDALSAKIQTLPQQLRASLTWD